MEEEKEPFLDSESSHSDNGISYARTAWSKRFLYFVSAVNLLVLLANALVSVHRIYYTKHSSTSTTCYEHFPNELTGATVRYEPEPHLFTKFQNSPYTGSPSEENDKAWHDLMENMVIRVTDEELARGQQTSLPLPQGGYMAWLGAYHELHCVKMLRQFKYRDYYHANVTENEYAHLSVHADHCLEMLRASAMCHGDGSLTTFKWSPNAAKPMLDLTRPSHKCVDWNVFMESVADRVVSQDEMAQMVNPVWE